MPDRVPEIPDVPPYRCGRTCLTGCPDGCPSDPQAQLVLAHLSLLHLSRERDEWYSRSPVSFLNDILIARLLTELKKVPVHFHLSVAGHLICLKDIHLCP